MSIAFAVIGFAALLSAAFIQIGRQRKVAPVVLQRRQPRPYRAPIGYGQRVYPTPADPLFSFRGREIRPLERRAA